MTANALKFQEIEERKRADRASEYLKASEQNIRSAELAEQKRSNLAKEEEAKAKRWTDFAVNVWNGLNAGAQAGNKMIGQLAGGLIAALL